MTKLPNYDEALKIIMRDGAQDVLFGMIVAAATNNDALAAAIIEGVMLGEMMRRGE